MNTTYLKITLLALLGVTILVGCGYDRDRKREGRKPSARKTTKEKTDETFKIRDVDGNTVILSQRRLRIKATLLGVNDTREVESYVKSQVSGPVSVSFDSEKPPRRLTNNARVYAYLNDQFGGSINAAILRDKASGLNTKYLTDSLYVFKQYADGAAPVRPTPRPVTPEPTPPKEDDTPPSNDKKFSVSAVSKAAFKVETYTKRGFPVGQGSGFFVTADGIGISNHHVFDGGDKWRITTCGDTKTYTVKPKDIISYDADLDYIIFKVNTSSPIPYLDRSNRTPEQGDDIYVYGNPKGLTCTLSKGVVSAIREYDNVSDNIVQIDAAISPGSSGSPIVNKRRRK
jgi:serine protease Do